MDPRTKFRGYTEAVHGGGASNLLLPDVSDPGIAYLSSGGNDGNAVVGDPFRPFYTAQAAITALIAFTGGGDCTISAGIGDFGSMDITGAASLTLLGVGAARTIFGVIYGSTGCNISGNGAMNVTVEAITFQAPNGSYGTDGGDASGGGTYATPGNPGTAGGSFGTINISGIYVVADATLSAGNGGGGGTGGNADSSAFPGTGGEGGAGGAGCNLICTDCIFGGYAVSIAGNGGMGGEGGSSVDNTFTGGDGGTSGDGGEAGSITLIRTQVGGVYAAPSAAGPGGDGGGGVNPGNTGAVGSPGGAGTINAQHSTIAAAPANGETTNYLLTIVAGAEM